MRETVLFPPAEMHFKLFFYEEKFFSETFFPSSNLSLNLIPVTLCCHKNLITEKKKLDTNLLKGRFNILPVWSLIF